MDSEACRRKPSGRRRRGRPDRWSTDAVGVLRDSMCDTSLAPIDAEQTGISSSAAATVATEEPITIPTSTSRTDASLLPPTE